jgi:hypothetical protein
LTLRVLIDVAPEADFYVESSARMRGVSRTRLLQAVIETVLEQQLIMDILRDSNLPTDKTTLGKPWNPRTRRRYAPRDKLFGDEPRRKSVYYSKPKMEETRKSRGRPLGSGRKAEEAPPPRQYDPSVRHPLINLRRGTTTIAPRNMNNRTRAEMEADLRQALLNTGGVPIDG